jgi:hypothetical protein
MIALAVWPNISHGVVMAIQTVEAWVHSVHRNFTDVIVFLGVFENHFDIRFAHGLMQIPMQDPPGWPPQVFAGYVGGLAWCSTFG